jgi:RNA-binding protein YlmH
MSSDARDTDSHDEFGLAAIDVRGDFLFVPLTREAVTEALRALLEPSQADLIGDIVLLGERGAQAVVASEIVPACLALNQVSEVPVTVSSLELADLAVRPPSVKDVKAVEASMRLDAVGSAGLGISRSKLVGLVKKGEVMVNWRPVTSPSSKVRIGDVVAIRGSSKVEVISVEPTTKGKWRISLRRTS